MKWWDWMPGASFFLMLSFKPAFPFLFYLHQEKVVHFLFAFCHKGGISSAYLRLLLFLPAILSPACASSSPAFCMMYSALKLDKQSDNTQSWCSPFTTWNQSVVPCPVLTIASWPAYRFLKRQVRWSGMPVFQNFPQFIVIHIIKGFGIVNKAEIDVFLGLSCFFNDPTDVGN